MALLDPKRIRRGNAVGVRYQLRDTRDYPQGKLIDPDGGVRITLFKPDGSVAVGPTSMTKVTTHPDFPKGLYEFLYQTTITPPSPLGSWMAECDETHQSFVSLSRREIAFILED